MNHKKIIVFTLVVFISFSIFLKQTVAGENKIANYRETILVLEELYKSEIIASKTYSGFAQKAAEEKYYSVARLFRALSESETVHARNFKNILNELGLEPKRFPEPDIKIADTKTNLKWALKVELSEIDTNYPKLINRIKPETGTDPPLSLGGAVVYLLYRAVPICPQPFHASGLETHPHFL